MVGCVGRFGDETKRPGAAAEVEVFDPWGQPRDAAVTRGWTILQTGKAASYAFIRCLFGQTVGHATDGISLEDAVDCVLDAQGDEDKAIGTRLVLVMGGARALVDHHTELAFRFLGELEGLGCGRAPVPPGTGKGFGGDGDGENIEADGATVGCQRGNEADRVVLGGWRGGMKCPVCITVTDGEIGCARGAACGCLEAAALVAGYTGDPADCLDPLEA